MALRPGSQIGPFEVISLLGEGGMGRVYRARDARLGRDVALKVLPDAFTSDADRLARFEREARVLASLNHPNIGSIHGIEQSGDMRALVLELVEGPSLADRIESTRGVGLPFDEALPIAHQIVDALAAAHGQGVIHRDLKPANIKLAGGASVVTGAPSVKVLDFGLARAMANESGDGSPAMSPTMTARATELGVILGTAAYMAPEQARGKPVDVRADIWAFGCVLYEMLTGKRAFESAEIADTLALVLTKEPDWSAIPRETPASIQRLLRRCLAKDRGQRLSDIADARLELVEATSAPSDGVEPAPGASTRSTRAYARRSTALAGIGVVALAASALMVIWAYRGPSPPRSMISRLSVGLGVDDVVVGRTGIGLGPGQSLALSPDGAALAFIGEEKGIRTLYVRRLDQLEAKSLPATTNAAMPFFSPDGAWIAFFADNALKKISIAGGTPITLCEATGARGGSWGDDGTIIFSANAVTTTGRAASGPLLRVSSTGGIPEPITALKGDDVTHRWPYVLPGAKAFLYTTHNRTNDYANARIVVQSAAGGEAKVIQQSASVGRYLSSGHLVFAREGTLFAVPFDVQSLEASGEAVPVVERVESQPQTGAVQFASAANGTIVYLPGLAVGDSKPIDWIDRNGQTSVLRATPANWSSPQFSPDGTRLALDIDYGAGNVEIAVYDWARDALTRLTFDTAHDRSPVWTPDGRRIVFSSNRAGSSASLFWVRADGRDNPQRLTDAGSQGPSHEPGSWHPGGRLFAFSIGGGLSADLWILPMEGNETSGWKPGKPYQFHATTAHESTPSFSPDGRWLAYRSSEAGNRLEIFVRPFSDDGGKWHVSSGGGSVPKWSRTSRELIYQAPDNRMLSVPYSVEGDSSRAETPRPWTERAILPRPRPYSWDLHPDGARIAAAAAREGETEAANHDSVVFVFNFFEELRRLAPPTR